MRLRSFLAVSVLFLLLLPAAMAHETRTYEIGGEEYEFTVGSQDEPIIVGQKTGLDLSVEDSDGEPVEGLDKTLQVEISAGGTSEVFDLESAWGEPGAYETTYIPTVATTITYRLFGTVDGTEVDLSFTCDGQGEVDEQPSADVTLVDRRSDFGCPASRAEMGFPEPTKSLYELENDFDTETRELGNRVDVAADDASSARALSLVALLLALIAAAVAGYTVRRET